ncbi:MAG: putative metal-binding motif-containing protein [Polyangiaceae bacterium]
MRARLVFGAAVTGLICFAAASCGSTKSGSSVDNASAGTASTSAGNGSASGGGSAASTGAGASAGTLTLVLPDMGTTDDAGTGAPSGDACGTTCPTGGTCSPEVCDGVDNNCDGIIDNVDKNGDGVCDCLLIATLGAAGTWGQGDVFATWLSARSNNGATPLADQVLTPALLSKYEVIVAQDLHQNHVYSPDEVAALQGWVKAGGGFMTLIGYSPPGDSTNVNRLLAPFGMNYGNVGILPRVNGMTVPITDWTPHPVDQGVTAVGVDSGYEIQGTGTVIARGGGFNVGMTEDVLPGHVFAWSDEWITYNSEWTQHADYQVELFWVNAIKWLTAATKCQVPVPTIVPK